jgi:hypothetical protein
VIWLAWRQFRLHAALAAVATAGAGAFLILLGNQIRDSYQTYREQCPTGAECPDLVAQFAAEYHNQVLVLNGLLMLVPLLIGLFWGAPLVAREAETGTHALVWNQSITRRRWLLTRLLVGIIAVVMVVQEPVCLWPGPPQFMADRPSPPDSVRIVTAAGEVKVCYSRPSARGRTVFGELVRWGRPWRTGANEPTLLHLPAAMEVAGVRLDAGRYVLLTIPERDAWLVLFHTSQATSPVAMFEDMVEVARGQATVEALDRRVETFTMRGVADGDAYALLLEWEHTRVRVPVRPIP